MITHLHLDPVGGVSGDMFLASLCALGLDIDPLEAAFQALDLNVRFTPVKRRVDGVAGTALDMDLPDGQPLRHLSEMGDIVRALDIEDDVKERSLAALRLLGEAESEAHAIPLEQVHFHEVGALDTVIDVVGAFWGLARLGVASVTCAPLPWFRGTMSCDHGLLALPAPAALRFLAGKPVYPTAATQEIITPTGALLIDQTVDAFATGPHGRITASGLAFGTYYVSGISNGLRAYLYEKESVAINHYGEQPSVFASPLFFVPTLQNSSGVYFEGNKGGAMKGDHEHKHEHAHEHTHEHEHEHEHPGIGKHAHPHAHAHAHGHVHEHKHPHSHDGPENAHAHEHTGDHGPHDHEHAGHDKVPHEDHQH